MLTSLIPLLAAASMAAGPRFVDRTAALGLTLSGEHAAWGDVNNDGWPDLFCGGVLWINNAGKGFTRVDVPGAGSGYIADIDNDGRGDLVCFSPIAILRNIGDGPDGKPKFEPIPLPTLPETLSRGAAVADFNNDGFLDVYIGGFENWEKQITYPSFLLLNEKGKGFTLAMTSTDSRARGITSCDFDEDGGVDIYCSNYRLQPNVLWVNDGHGKFTDQAAKFGILATSPGFKGGHSIGACWGDFDEDGHFDLFAGNFAHVDNRGDQPKSRFLRNLGPVGKWKFNDLGECGISYQESYASPACADFDNDGHLDLYFTTVYPLASFKKANFPVLYRNDTPAGFESWKFVDVTPGSGLEKLPPTYQAAWADFDGDGDLDLVTAGKLFVNMRLEPGQLAPKDSHWLEVRLIGDGVRVNRDAIGTQVRIRMPDGRTLSRQVECGTGEGNANSPILHFGLGTMEGPFTIDVRWPGRDESGDLTSTGMRTLSASKVRPDQVIIMGSNTVPPEKK